MVARRFVVLHNGAEFPVDYDTDHGLEVLQFQIFSLTSVPPEDQKILAADQHYLLDDSTDLDVVSEKLRLVSIEESENFSKYHEKSDNELARILQTVAADEHRLVDDSTDLDVASEKLRLVPIEEAENSSKSHEKSDEELARMLQAEEEALLLQEYSVVDNGDEFRKRVEPYLKQVMMYEDPRRQKAARETVPLNELEEKALISLAKEGNLSPSKDEQDHAFLLQLLFWFKQSFRWVNAPPCDKCGSETTNIGMGTPWSSELEFGASRVEVYRCKRCSSMTRFPRYNDPYKLVETRKGRCGEWANCFTHYCRAFGYDARLVLDFTDHVWTECYSNSLGRWMHLDPCEGVYDNPLLYENGWGKKLNYVIGISKDGVHDVTKRYTRKWHELLGRRIIATESTVSSILHSITIKLRNNYSPEIKSILNNRDKNELQELEKNSYLKSDLNLSLPGRQSGSIEWRKSRSELGLTETEALSLSSCPIRKCVDNHVTNLYSAFSLLLSDQNTPGEEIINVLNKIKGLIVDLKSQPFKERKSCLDLKGHAISEKMRGFVEKLFGVISLKGEFGDDGLIKVGLNGNPVNTSLAIPVALDLIDEIVNNNYKNYNHLNDGLSFPRENRVCDGMVIASGEQLPDGISTSAFDGTHAYKWEEPNGAKGCWLIYKVPDDKLYDLESYDLVSANDCPERDPMNWVLEASVDEGLNWKIIDKQSSQFFEGRFLRKSFRVETRYSADTFRFRVLSVKDPDSQSRFQIGSIDLYAKNKFFIKIR